MKIHGWVIGLLLFLTSCQANISQTSSTVVPITETLSVGATNTPTAIFINTSEPTPTEVIIPDYMKEFIQKGYGESGRPDIMYADIREAKPHTANTPIEYRGVLIYSWITGVYYVDKDGMAVNNGIVVDGVCKNSGEKDYIFDLFGSDQISHSASCPSKAFFTNQRVGLNKIVVDIEGFITQFQLGVGEDTQLERAELYAELFPSIEPVEIPGIGIVLPVTRTRFVGFNDIKYNQ